MPQRTLSHPERVIPQAFLVGIAIGTLLLSLPIARVGDQLDVGGAPLVVALFTATSALCVTGLTVVDTASYWTTFGHIIILALAQIGGFGIMTGATLLGMLMSRRMRLRGRMLAQSEMRSLDLGDVTAVVKLVLVATLIAELLLATALFLRFWLGLGAAPLDAAWDALFHAVSAFNNAGFVILPEGLAPHAGDWLLLSPIMLGVVLGGIGFPVLHELSHEWRTPDRWSIHSKLTLYGTAALLMIGFAVILLAEWNNPATLGPENGSGKMLGALFHSVMTRSGGLNIHDTGAMTGESLLMSTGLMLIGGGSAGTAGGIKVTTFLLLGFVVWAEVRGQPDTVAFRRRIANDVQRQALAIVLLAIGMVGLGCLAIMALSPFRLEQVLFEVVSAFATVGLSAGITADLPPPAQLVLVLLMFVGRVGTVSVAAALALRVKSVPYRYPEERPIVG